MQGGSTLLFIHKPEEGLLCWQIFSCDIVACKRNMFAPTSKNALGHEDNRKGYKRSIVASVFSLLFLAGG